MSVRDRIRERIRPGESIEAFYRWHREKLGGPPEDTVRDGLLEIRIDNWRRSITGEPAPPLEMDAPTWADEHPTDARAPASRRFFGGDAPLRMDREDV